MFHVIYVCFLKMDYSILQCCFSRWWQGKLSYPLFSKNGLAVIEAWVTIFSTVQAFSNWSQTEVSSFGLRRDGRIVLWYGALCKCRRLYERTVGCVGNGRDGFGAMGLIASGALQYGCSWGWNDYWVWRHCADGLSGSVLQFFRLIYIISFIIIAMVNSFHVDFTVINMVGQRMFQNLCIWKRHCRVLIKCRSQLSRKSLKNT